MPHNSSEKPVAPKKSSLLPGFFLLLFFVSFAGWLAWMYGSDTHLSQQYHHAPGCFPGARTELSLPPCRNATLRVTRQWGSDDNLLDLTEQGSDPWTETVSDQVWRASPVGSRVAAQVWKGQVVRVWVGGLVSRTNDNPDSNARQDLLLLKELGVILLLGTVFFSTALVNWFRQVRGLPVSLENVYAVRVQGDCLTLSLRRYTQIGTVMIGLMMLGGIVFFAFTLAIIGHYQAGFSWPVLAAGLGVFALLAWLGRRSKFLAVRLFYLLLMLPVILGRIFLSFLGNAGRALLLGERWSFDRNRDRVLHNDQSVAGIRDIADVQLKESKSARGRLRRALSLAARDGTEIGAGIASSADMEETEYLAERLADFLGCPLQRRQEKDEEADAAPQAEPPVVLAADPQRREVPYASTFADYWRTNLYFMRRRRFATLYSLLVLPALGGYFWLPPYLHQGNYLGAAGLVALMLAGCAAYTAALMALIIWWLLARRGDNRECRFVIGADGFDDVMPEKTTTTLWRDVKAVEEHGSDIYFFRAKAGGKAGARSAGTFLPRSAFSDPTQAQAFYETALSLWKEARGEGS